MDQARTKIDSKQSSEETDLVQLYDFFVDGLLLFSGASVASTGLGSCDIARPALTGWAKLCRASGAWKLKKKGGPQGAALPS